MAFAQRRNRLATHFSERTPVVKRRISVIKSLFSSSRISPATTSIILIQIATCNWRILICNKSSFHVSSLLCCIIESSWWFTANFQIEYDKLGEGGEKYTQSFGRETGRNNSEGTRGNIKMDIWVWNEFIWTRVGTSSGVLWTRSRICGYLRGVSRLAKQPLDSEDRIYSLELIITKFSSLLHISTTLHFTSDTALL